MSLPEKRSLPSPTIANFWHHRRPQDIEPCLAKQWMRIISETHTPSFAFYVPADSPDTMYQLGIALVPDLTASNMKFCFGPGYGEFVPPSESGFETLACWILNREITQE